MNKPRCDEYDYINFLIATQRIYSCTEAAKVQPEKENAPAHDSLNRLLYRINVDTEPLWEEAKKHVVLNKGLLVFDDTTLDKLYAKKIELVSYVWSGKHHQVVKGIDVSSLIWTDGDSCIPTDYAVYEKGKETRNDHFRRLLKKAKERGFEPKYVSFDSWFASLENLKLIRLFKWQWFTRFKSNRLVDDGKGNRPIREVEIPEEGRMVHLKAYGMIKIFKLVPKDGDIEYWATSELGMSAIKRLSIAEKAWQIEIYHRGVKQYCGIEKCQARAAVIQLNHIGCAIRAFLRIERYSFRTGKSWFEAKIGIVRDAVRSYLASPIYENYLSTA
jgi:putative transposase